MLIGCGGVLALFLMIFGGMFYEEASRMLGETTAWVLVVVLSIALVGVVVRLITLRAPAVDSEGS